MNKTPALAYEAVEEIGDEITRVGLVTTNTDRNGAVLNYKCDEELQRFLGDFSPQLKHWRFSASEAFIERVLDHFGDERNSDIYLRKVGEPSAPKTVQPHSDLRLEFVRVLTSEKEARKVLEIVRADPEFRRDIDNCTHPNNSSLDELIGDRVWKQEPNRLPPAAFYRILEAEQDLPGDSPRLKDVKDEVREDLRPYHGKSTNWKDFEEWLQKGAVSPALGRRQRRYRCLYLCLGRALFRSLQTR